ncbi:MAG: hypothetical protein ACTSRZ_17425 [Promethearchaeota archaeon]
MNEAALIFFSMFLVIFILLLLFYIIVLKRKHKEDIKNYIQQYPATYLCRDGHKVRSLSELILDNALYRHNIRHQYEDYVSKKENDPKYKYDFYLPDAEVYIEFFGFSGKKYHDTRIKKEKFYKQKRLKMVAFEPQDLVEIDKSLRVKLGFCWDKIASPRHCPNCGGELDERI